MKYVKKMSYKLLRNKKKLVKVIQYFDQNQEVSRIYIGELELNGESPLFVISARLQA